MAWLRLDDRFTGNRKIVDLTDHEFRVWMRTLCYCARAEDPTVDAKTIREVGGLTPKMVTKLATKSLLDMHGDTHEVHDWAKYLPKDKTGAERQARWRARRRNQAKKPDPEGVTETVTETVTDSVTNGVTDPHENPCARADLPVPVVQNHPPTDVVQYEAGGRVANEIEGNNNLEPLDATSLFEDIQRKLAAKEQA